MLAAARLQRGLRIAADNIGKAGQGYLRRYAPRKTGHFASSIRPRVTGEGIAYHVSWTGANPPAAFLVHGTRPHDIEPNGARCLAFEVNGSMVFTMHVHHPGTKPDKFRQKAWPEITLSSKAILRAAILSSLSLA